CDPAGWRRPLLGQPIPNVEFHVEGGELTIGGGGVARGYRNRPDLDAERFVWQGGRPFYRTGDRVVVHPDGAVGFAGRRARQPKLRGRLVAPEEIEARCRSHPGVVRAAVVQAPLRWLIAYVAPADIDTAALRGHLAAGLPAWMLPHRIVPLAALPTTPAGK